MQWLTKASFQVLAWLPRSLRDPLVLSRIHADLGALSDVVVKIAETSAEHEQASRLLFQAYAEHGLVEQCGVPVRVTPFLMLPTTVRFVAVVRGEVVGTCSLIQDSELGLPMEAAYGDAVAGLRSQGELLAEIGALGVKAATRGHGLPLLLYKAVWKTAVELLGIRRLVVGVRPDVGVLYAAALRFEPLAAQTRRYPGINGDSMALCLDLERAPAEFARAFSRRPVGRFNPYTYFVKTEHPQLKLPRSAAELAPLRATHQRAALRLAWLRPEAVTALGAEDFAALESAVLAG